MSKSKHENNMSYYCVIPARVMLDPDLQDKAKLLYGHIAGLANEKGYCWAQNSYFEQIFDCSESTAIRLLNALADKEYIIKRIIYSEQNPQEVLERRLYINDPLITLVIDEQQ